MKKKLVYNLFFLISGLLLLLNVSHAVPEGGTINASPSSGNKLVNEEFNVVIGVTGSRNFTVFKGTVSLTNLTVVSFTNTLGGNVQCQTTPSAGSLSFNCGVEGATGVPNINVYTIRVKATSSGIPTSVNISGGLIIGTSPTTELTVSYTPGSYTIAAPTSTPVPPTSTPVPTAAPTHTNVPGTSHAPTKTPTPTPTCAPVCTGKTCGDDACGGVCGTCLSGYSCDAAFACIADPYLTEDEFLDEWDGIDNIGDVGLQLGFEPGDIVLGPDGTSLGGFRFFGRTAPNVMLNLYIFSTPLIKTTTSDVNGDWSIIINEPLAAGDHKVYAVIVTNGIETKNSEIVAFNINPVSGIVALTDSIPVTPKPTVTPVPTTTGSSTTLPIILSIVALLLIGGFLIMYKKKKKKLNKKVEVKSYNSEKPIEPEHDTERKISSLGEEKE